MFEVWFVKLIYVTEVHNNIFRIKRWWFPTVISGGFRDQLESVPPPPMTTFIIMFWKVLLIDHKCMFSSIITYIFAKCVCTDIYTIKFYKIEHIEHYRFLKPNNFSSNKFTKQPFTSSISLFNNRWKKSSRIIIRKTIRNGNKEKAYIWCIGTLFYRKGILLKYILSFATAKAPMMVEY